MIFATWVNPYIRHHPFNGTILSQAALTRMARSLFERVYGRKADVQFWEATNDYYHSQGDFSDDGMSLAFFEESCKQRVRSALSSLD